MGREDGTVCVEMIAKSMNDVERPRSLQLGVAFLSGIHNYSNTCELWLTVAL